MGVEEMDGVMGGVAREEREREERDGVEVDLEGGDGEVRERGDAEREVRERVV